VTIQQSCFFSSSFFPVSPCSLTRCTFDPLYELNSIDAGKRFRAPRQHAPPGRRVGCGNWFFFFFFFYNFFFFFSYLRKAHVFAGKQKIRRVLDPTIPMVDPCGAADPMAGGSDALAPAPEAQPHKPALRANEAVF
jgi:hypothetical protein